MTFIADEEKKGDQENFDHEQFPTQPEEQTDIVSWDGPDDPTNPKNWAFSKRWGVCSQ